jgi:hypothetical protein
MTMAAQENDAGSRGRNDKKRPRRRRREECCRAAAAAEYDDDDDDGRGGGGEQEQEEEERLVPARRRGAAGTAAAAVVANYLLSLPALLLLLHLRSTLYTEGLPWGFVTLSFGLLAATSFLRIHRTGQEAAADRWHRADKLRCLALLFPELLMASCLALAFAQHAFEAALDRLGAAAVLSACTAACAAHQIGRELARGGGRQKQRPRKHRRGAERRSVTTTEADHGAGDVPLLINTESIAARKTPLRLFLRPIIPSRSSSRGSTPDTAQHAHDNDVSKQSAATHHDGSNRSATSHSSLMSSSSSKRSSRRKTEQPGQHQLAS